ncbi:MAG TPA: diguanylate cyclase [Anaerolineales bacterium]|nr:diguanylate cyclase [Anaerolineales bacterium]
MKPNISELENQLENAPDQKARIDTLNELAWAIHLDDRAKARGLAEQAQTLSSSGEYEQEAHWFGLASSLRCLAALDNDTGHYDQALVQALRALEILERNVDATLEAAVLQGSVLGLISWSYRCLGDYVIAAETAMKSLKLAQEMGNRQIERGMLNVLSVIYAEQNDLPAALEIGLEVLQYSREEGAVWGECLALNNLAMTYLEMGEGAKALATCQEGLKIAQENKMEALALTVLTTMGEIYLGIKEFAKAEEHLLRALTLAREQGGGFDELQCLLNLGKVYQSQQRDSDALSNLKSAISLSQSSNDRRGEFQAHQLLSEVYEKRGEFETALFHFKQFHALKETIFNESTAKRLSGLQVIHQVETAKRDAEINFLKTIELNREIEERKTAQADLERLVSIDPLTGVLNRREFFIRGERETANALLTGQPLSVILLDLDHFKQVNDTYGHAAGDQVLITTTQLVRENLRQDELIGRYGGDEFIILLPGSDCSRGQQIAKRLYRKIASHAVPTAKGPIPIALSLGIAELSQTHDASLETLLAYADQALYAAKRAGRNRLAVYSPALS